MRAIVLVALVAGLGGWPSCAPSTGQPPPTPTTSPAPSSLNVADCDDACATAQSKCRTHSPKPIDHCLGKCRASGAVSGSVSCIAVMFTCDEECQ